MCQWFDGLCALRFALTCMTRGNGNRHVQQWAEGESRHERRRARDSIIMTLQILSRECSEPANALGGGAHLTPPTPPSPSSWRKQLGGGLTPPPALGT